MEVVPYDTTLDEGRAHDGVDELAEDGLTELEGVVLDVPEDKEGVLDGDELVVEVADATGLVLEVLELITGTVEELEVSAVEEEVQPVVPVDTAVAFTGLTIVRRFCVVIHDSTSGGESVRSISSAACVPAIISGKVVRQNVDQVQDQLGESKCPPLALS